MYCMLYCKICHFIVHQSLSESLSPYTTNLSFFAGLSLSSSSVFSSLGGGNSSNLFFNGSTVSFDLETGLLPRMKQHVEEI